MQTNQIQRLHGYMQQQHQQITTMVSMFDALQNLIFCPDSPSSHSDTTTE